MARPPEEIVEQMLDVVKRFREGRVLRGTLVSRVELGRRLWFAKHCGQRMWQVKVFYTDTTCNVHKELHERRGADEHVCPCPDCLYHYANLPALAWY